MRAARHEEGRDDWMSSAWLHVPRQHVCCPDGRRHLLTLAAGRWKFEVWALGKVASRWRREGALSPHTERECGYRRVGADQCWHDRAMPRGCPWGGQKDAVYYTTVSDYSCLFISDYKLALGLGVTGRGWARPLSTPFAPVWATQVEGIRYFPPAARRRSGAVVRALAWASGSAPRFARVGASSASIRAMYGRPGRKEQDPRGVYHYVADGALKSKVTKLSGRF